MIGLEDDLPFGMIKFQGQAVKLPGGSFRPLRIGLWDPFQMAFHSMAAINGVILTTYILTGMILQVNHQSVQFLENQIQTKTTKNKPKGMLTPEKLTAGYPKWRHISGQISIIPKPELRGFWGIPLLNHHLRWPRSRYLKPEMHLKKNHRFWYLSHELTVGIMIFFSSIPGSKPLQMNPRRAPGCVKVGGFPPIWVLNQK